ncbi:hypothetical protein BGZ61DRAFT_474618 [Ilyonectria robusta]|uniref:uncharacterized protein n=1 Tax=Ilyonectria robusta TaxID=1079257 RepID=UPI001E8CF84D|nr:uncharacterized protein BGZ61DRAFT_474618 [Ilyonectria robusta]KAH8733990.1 hypothetical protein BGZ61DRAFT_474618 [Ilyonectria robusta]
MRTATSGGALCITVLGASSPNARPSQAGKGGHARTRQGLGTRRSIKPSLDCILPFAIPSTGQKDKRTKGNKDANNAKTDLQGTAKSTRHHASQPPRTSGRGALRRLSGQGTVGAGARYSRGLNETEDAIKGKSSHEQGPQRG